MDLTVATGSYAMRELADCIRQLRLEQTHPQRGIKDVERNGNGEVIRIIDRAPNVDISALIARGQKAIAPALEAARGDQDEYQLTVALYLDWDELVDRYLPEKGRQERAKKRAEMRDKAKLVEAA